MKLALDINKFAEGNDWILDESNSKYIYNDEEGYIRVVDGVSIPDYALYYIEIYNGQHKKMLEKHEIRKKMGVTVPSGTGPKMKIY